MEFQLAIIGIHAALLMDALLYIYTEISQQEKPVDFEENKDVARRGGKVAGVARKETEKELGHSVISSKNYLNLESDENGTLSEDNLS